MKKLIKKINFWYEQSPKSVARIIGLISFGLILGISLLLKFIGGDKGVHIFYGILLLLGGGFSLFKSISGIIKIRSREGDRDDLVEKSFFFIFSLVLIGLSIFLFLV